MPRRYARPDACDGDATSFDVQTHHPALKPRVSTTSVRSSGVASVAAASVGASLRGFNWAVARAVLVATCAEVAGDGAAVAAYLDAALPPDLRRRVALDLSLIHI